MTNCDSLDLQNYLDILIEKQRVEFVAALKLDQN